MKSYLRIHDLATDTSRTVLVTDTHIEAPNWAPDDQSLLVNGGGALCKVPLSAPDLIPLDTGHLHNLNNDHGISPDGRTLALSDKTETGESRIYVMPIGGGMPRLVTERGHSYWHGWSPDGETLAYAARRDDSFQIHVIPVGGGDERQLTHGFDHCDGPDYTADGRWIWFNGEKDGAVDLWRVAAAGGDPERMTEDSAVNWFPHPSPDGSHVLYLAYPPGTRGHPANLDVDLRLLPATGGVPRTVAQVFGGQGTINVPCWAPDGRAFAYVEYARPDAV